MLKDQVVNDKDTSSSQFAHTKWIFWYDICSSCCNSTLLKGQYCRESTLLWTYSI